MLLSTTSTYTKSSFDNEAELEQVVLRNSESLFGSSIIILPKFRINSEGGAGTIPDAYVINIETKEWYIVEAELGHHNVWEHIIGQISRQLTAAERAASREKIITSAYTMIQRDNRLQLLFSELGIDTMDIYPILQSIIAKHPVVAIPIDDIPVDLEIWARTLNRTVKIWLIQKFTNTAGDVIYSIPDDAAPSIATSGGNIIEQPQSTKWFAWLMERNLISTGDILTMTYKQNSFTGIVRASGIEVDGVTYSVSRSALICIQTIKPDAQTINGYIKWKTRDNKYLDTLIQEYRAKNNDIE